MGRNTKCVFCHKPANAYRLESDGSKTYLCLDHIPVTEQIPAKDQAVTSEIEEAETGARMSPEPGAAGRPFSLHDPVLHRFARCARDRAG